MIGGIIPDVDIPKLKAAGVKGIFLPGTPMQEIIDFIGGNALSAASNRLRRTAPWAALVIRTVTGTSRRPKR